MKIEVIALALTASGFTAVASVAQRRAASPASADLQFNWRLVCYLLRRPVWFIGIASMICGFAFQVQALRSGSLSLVQPIIATELVLVFGIMAIHEGHRVRAHDWLSALGMVVGLGAFLAIARPAGGHAQSTGSTGSSRPCRQSSSLVLQPRSLSCRGKPLTTMPSRALGSCRQSGRRRAPTPCQPAPSSSSWDRHGAAEQERHGHAHRVVIAESKSYGSIERSTSARCRASRLERRRTLSTQQLTRTT